MIEVPLYGRRRTEPRAQPEREFFINNLLVRIHLIIVMIRWTGLAFESPFPGSLTSTFLEWVRLRIEGVGCRVYSLGSRVGFRVHG